MKNSTVTLIRAKKELKRQKAKKPKKKKPKKKYLQKGQKEQIFHFPMVADGGLILKSLVQKASFGPVEHPAPACTSLHSLHVNSTERKWFFYKKRVWEPPGDVCDMVWR